MKDVNIIADWFRFVNYKNEESKSKNIQLTRKRLMVLLYFVQGVYMANYHQPAFQQNIINKHVPYIQNLNVNNLNLKKSNRIAINRIKGNYKKIESNSKIYNIVSSVHKCMRNSSTFYLIHHAKTESTFLTTNYNQIISKDKIQSYFNWLNLSIAFDDLINKYGGQLDRDSRAIWDSSITANNELSISDDSVESDIDFGINIDIIKRALKHLNVKCPKALEDI